MSLINMRDQATAFELLGELLQLDSGLSSWELEFILSLEDWNGHFTEAQYEKLEEVHGRHF